MALLVSFITIQMFSFICLFVILFINPFSFCFSWWGNYKLICLLISCSLLPSFIYKIPTGTPLPAEPSLLHLKAASQFFLEEKIFFPVSLQSEVSVCQMESSWTWSANNLTTLYCTLPLVPIQGITPTLAMYCYPVHENHYWWSPIPFMKSNSHYKHFSLMLSMAWQLLRHDHRLSPNPQNTCRLD